MSPKKKLLIVAGGIIILLVYGTATRNPGKVSEPNVSEPNMAEPNMVKPIDSNDTYIMELIPPEVNEPKDPTMELTGLDLEYFCLNQERRAFTSQELRKKEIVDPNALLSLWDQKTEKIEEIGNEIITETLLKNKLAAIKAEIEGKKFIECSYPNGFCARFLIEPGSPTLYLVAGLRIPCEEGTKIDWENGIGEIFRDPSLTKNVQEALTFLENYSLN